MNPDYTNLTVEIAITSPLALLVNAKANDSYAAAERAKKIDWSMYSKEIHRAIRLQSIAEQLQALNT
jgi:hypothetical protein